MSSKFNWFLVLLIISLAGNAAADFALVWHGIDLLSKTTGSNDLTLQVFYTGQAIGVLLLGPILASRFDRLPKNLASFFLDLSYGLLLLLGIVLFQSNVFGPAVVLSLAALTAAIGLVHKSAVAFYAVQALSPSGSSGKDVTKLIMALNSSYLLGSAISGFVYKHLGVTGCFLMGIVTFIPISVSYFFFFSGEKPVAKPRESWWFSIRLGLAELTRHRELLGFMLSLSALNIVAAVMPAWVGLALERQFPGQTDVYATIVAAGIGVGIIATPLLSNWAHSIRLRNAFVMALIPYVGAAIAYFIYPSMSTVFALFAVNCAATAFLSVIAGVLRVNLIPKENIGRLNTVFSTALYVGQILGGVLFLPLFRELGNFVIAVISVVLALLAAVNWALAPGRFVKEYVK